LNDQSQPRSAASGRAGVLHRLRERGVLRVAASYAVIAWLTLQIGSVVFDPLGMPKWVMTALIIVAAVGFPIAIALAWFLEIGEHGVEVDRSDDGEPRPSMRGLRHYADAVVIGILLIAVVVLFVRQSEIGKPKPPANPAIAVLPFENLGGDPQQEYFADGLAQEVLDRLGRVPGLTVIARSSSFSFKGKNVDSKTIAERLGVTTLLEGSVRRVGNRLKLSADLVDGASGRQIWSGTFDREVTDVFQVQEELAAAVIEAIVPAARGATAGKVVSPTSDMNAYDLYLLGRAAQEARTGQRLRDSVGYLEKAIAADPKYAKAHAALSRSLFLWTIFTNVPAPTDAVERAEAEAHEALALDPNSSEAHAALGTVLRERNPAAAEEEYKRALQLNPSNTVALWDYGVLLSQDPKRDRERSQLRERLERLDPRSAILWQQRLEEAASQRDGGRAFRAQFEKALVALDGDPDGLNLVGRAAGMNGYAPEAYRVTLSLGRSGTGRQALAWQMVDDLQRAGQLLDEAARHGADAGRALADQAELAGIRGDFAAWSELDRRLRETSADDPAMWRSSAFWLAIQERYGEAAEALAKGQPLRDVSPGPLGACMLGGRQLLPAILRIYRATGRGKEADTMAQHYFEMLRGNPDVAFDLAALAANEGHRDEAVRALKEAFEQAPLIIFFQPALPWFRSLEGHPGYEEILAERSRRIEKAHAEMLRIEAAASTTTPPAK
jgi:TolB-like protein/Flp pilus assembly protein TadD